MSFVPPRCPNTDCTAHADPVAGFYIRIGTYAVRCRPLPRQLFAREVLAWRQDFMEAMIAERMVGSWQNPGNASVPLVDYHDGWIGS